MKTKMCQILVLLMIATSGVTAQEHKIKKSEKSPIEKFLLKVAKAQHFQNYKFKSVSEDLITGFDIDFWAGEQWFPSSHSVLTYDSGKLSTRTTSVEFFDEWYISEKKTNSYTNGLLTLELLEVTDEESGELVPDERTGYTYKAGTSPAIVETITYQWWTGNSWVIGDKDEFEVSDNMITGGTYYEWDGSALEPVDKFTVSTEGENVILTYEYWIEGSWIKLDRNVYQGITIQELYDESFEQNVMSEIPFLLLNEISFDVIYQEWSGTEWENSERNVTEKTFGTNSELLLETINTEYWDGGEWQAEESLKIHYNGKANPDSAVISYYLGLDEEVQWGTYLKDIYSYDSNGLFDSVIVMLNFDEGLENFYRYKFWWNGSTTSAEEPEEVSAFTLKPAYPNPFNPATNITYSMAKSGFVSIEVFDLLGRRVATLENNYRQVGEHTVRFDAGSLSSGQYIVRMQTPGYVKTQSITLIK